MEIDVWSDIACPWCYVGKRRLRAALASFEDSEDVSVRWHSFELDHAAPAAYEGEHAERIARKYGRSVEETERALQSMSEIAAAEGLELNFAGIRAGNTFDAHRLLQLALEHGHQDEVKEQLMRAYFRDGELISDHTVLQRIGEQSGLPAASVQEMLASDAFGEQVRQDEVTAQQLGIDAVPFFVIDRRLAVRGALDAPQLLDALRQAAQLATDGSASSAASATK
jgi:predicted DsbA family dithiol-disulfide isomerase